ncbi:hypothetical protein Tco_0795729 [Tanacetum coccineum]
MYYPQFTKVIIHQFLTKDKTISKRNKISMHTSKDYYLINTLRFVSAKEESQIYGDRLPKSRTSLEMWESKAYKTYLGYATRSTPPKKAQKFKKPSSPKLTTVPVLDVIEEELSESEAKSWGRDEDDRNNDHESSNEGSDRESDSGNDNTQSDNEKGSDFKHETDENETGSKSNQEENEEENEDDEEEKDDEFVKTNDDEDETNNESKVKDKAEGNEDKGLDYTTNQFDDDVNVRLNEPVDTNEGFIQKECTDAEMVNVHKRNENPEIILNQVIEDAHVTISTVAKKTEVPILPKEVSNFAPSKIKRMVTESLDHAVLAKESSQPKSTYEAAASLTEFELKKILIDEMNESQSYLTATDMSTYWGEDCYP